MRFIRFAPTRVLGATAAAFGAMLLLSGCSTSQLAGVNAAATVVPASTPAAALATAGTACVNDVNVPKGTLLSDALKAATDQNCLAALNDAVAAGASLTAIIGAL